MCTDSTTGWKASRAGAGSAASRISEFEIPLPEGRGGGTIVDVVKKFDVEGMRKGRWRLFFTSRWCMALRLIQQVIVIPGRCQWGTELKVR